MRTIFKKLAPCIVHLSFVWIRAAGDGDTLLTDTQVKENGVGWTDKGVVEGATYSVIVIDTNPRPSNQLRDQQRVRAYSKLNGDRIVSVQFVNPVPLDPWVIDKPPYSVGHPDGVDKRVRLVFIADIGNRLSPETTPDSNQVCIRLTMNIQSLELGNRHALFYVRKRTLSAETV